jgi:NAD+ synthetase
LEYRNTTPYNVEDPKQFIDMLRTQLESYLTEYKLESCVLGVSGGLDSALVAAIAAPICKKLHVQFICASLPSATNKPDEVDRASRTLAFGSSAIIRLIDEDLVSIPYISAHPDKQEKIRLGNVKARVRMILLYDLAGHYKGIVLGTDNWTEKQLGFWTLHGDVGDFNLIQNVTKSDVYILAQWLADHELTDGLKQVMLDTIAATPTDGLGITSSDLEQIGASSYQEVDRILLGFFQGQCADPGHPVIQRHERTHFKRANPKNVGD